MDEIQVELIQAGLCSEVHKHINWIWNKDECYSSGQNTLLYLFNEKDDKTDCSNT
jgi:hypothetical protein